MPHHRWLADVNGGRVIRIEVSELLLEARTLQFPNECLTCLWSSMCIPNLGYRVPEAFQKLATTSLHEPDFGIRIGRKRVVERLRNAG